MSENYQYYPALSELIETDAIPDALNFIEVGIDDVFDKIYYKNYINSISDDGSSSFHRLEVISRKKLAIELFGSGLSLILNPDFDNSNISSFPINIFWSWEILKYVRNFNLSKFSFKPEDLFNLGISILNVDKEIALQLAVRTFVIPTSPSLSSFDQLVLDINALYGTSISIDDSDEDKFRQLIIVVELEDKNIFTTIFLLYVLNNNLQIAKDNISYFFSSLLPTDLESYIKELFIPKIRATLTLTAALEFPRSVLVPMKFVGDELVKDETVDSGGNLKKSYFQFAEADFSFDTEGRLGADVEFAGSLIHSIIKLEIQVLSLALQALN